MKRQAQKGINKTAGKGLPYLTDNELKMLSNQLTGESCLVFMLMVSTGRRFREIKKIRWSSFNSLLNTLEIAGVNFNIPVACGLLISSLREQALSENSPIIKKSYKQVWDKTSRAYFSLGISQDYGILKRARLTYCRKHYQLYRNKARLARDLGVTTTRWIPKPVFEIKNTQPCLVQF